MRCVEGQANVLADALSRHPNYEPVEIPLVQGTNISHMVIDVLLEDCFEALSRGHLVTEQRFPSCQIALPYEQLAAQGTIDRSPRPSVLHVVQRSNIKVSIPHLAISGLSCGR